MSLSLYKFSSIQIPDGKNTFVNYARLENHLHLKNFNIRKQLCMHHICRLNVVFKNVLFKLHYNFGIVLHASLAYTAF